MRVDEQGKIIIAFTDVVPAVMTREAYYKVIDRENVQRVQRACRGRNAEVYFDSFSSKRQIQICDKLGDPRMLLGLLPNTSATKSHCRERVPFNELSTKEMQLCNAKYNIVRSYREFAAEHGAQIGVTAAKKEFITMVQSGFACVDSYAIVGSLSFQTVERWNKELRDGGDIMDALAPLRAPKTGTSLTAGQKKMLVDQYCQPSAPTFAASYRMSCRLWKLNGEPLPTESMCRRFLMEWESHNRNIVIMRRKGIKEHNDACMPSIQRDINSIQFMDVLVSDGHVLNLSIANPTTGRPCRPTMVAWIDMRTQYILGFELMVTENTMSVASSFRRSCIQAARLMGVDGAVLPRSVYMDNGRAFKNKELGGVSDLKTQIGGLFERLKPYGLELVQYSKPYNAQTKIIERSWRDFDEIEKMAITYTGNNIENKPAYLKRNEIWHREEQVKAIAQNGYPTLWGAYKVIEWFIDQYNQQIRSGDYLPGISPVQLAMEHIQTRDFHERLVDKRAFDMMVMNSKTAKLTKNGFKINKVWYYNPLFYKEVTNGDTYILRYDILNPEKIMIFREDGTFWCDAGISPFQGVHAMAALGSEADKIKLRRTLHQQNDIKNASVREAIGISNTSPAAFDQPALTAASSNLLPPSATLMPPTPEIVPPEPEIKLRFF